MNKILTVSIAAYNVEKYIETALKPFARDEYIGMIEVFVIDDGGSDDTLNIASAYAAKYPEIFIPVHKENSGWGSTVNYGITHATGKYFKQLDGDDYFNPDNMSTFLEKLISSDADMIYTSFVTFEDGSNKILSISEMSNKIDLNKTIDYESVAHNTPLAMHNYTFRTKMLQDNGIHITEKCFYTDIEFVIKAAAKAKTVMFLDLDIYFYRIARLGQSMSYPGVRKHYKEHLLITKSLIKYVESLNVTPNKRIALEDRVQYLINNQYSIFFILIPNGQHKRELKEYDDYIKENAPFFYEKVPQYVIIARKHSFLGYSVWVALRYVNHLKNLVTRGY